jgi:hypothetical protein
VPSGGPPSRTVTPPTSTSGIGDVLTEVAFAAGSRDLDPLASLDLLCWQHRGGDQTADPGHLPEPYRAFLSGGHQGAARWWEERGCPYDSALALAKRS